MDSCLAGKSGANLASSTALEQASIALSKWNSFNNVFPSSLCFSQVVTVSSISIFGSNLLNKQRIYSKQIIRMSRWVNEINEDVRIQDKRCMDNFMRFMKKINPCLRPETESTRLTNFLEKFMEVSVYEDPYFGQSFLLESIMENQLIILKKEKVPEHLFESRKKQIQGLQIFNGNPHIVNQTLIEDIHKVGFLWSKHELYLAYDYILVDLSKQFEYRMTQKKKFTETEIVNIMKGACKGFIHLQSTEYASIQMKYIYFTKNGFVKIAHPKLFKYRTNLQIICENDEEKGLYLSPEEIVCLERGDKDAILGWKSNCYAFGMIILSLMNLQYIDEIYDYGACYIDTKRIAQLLKNCKQLYSDKLVSIIENLLAVRPENRLTLRSVLNKLTYKLESNNEIDIELLNQESKPEQIQPYYPPSSEPTAQPEHFNYLRGMVYPKVGRMGQYFDDKEVGKYHNDPREESVIANQRIFYDNRNSNYIGDSIEIGKTKLVPSLAERNSSVRHGKGFYKNSDGQLYLGQWSKGEMHGYGKLYWDEQKIRYEGDFNNGKFEGRGIEYNPGKERVGEADKDDAIDETFVRMQKDNWVKYEGNFKNDKREGQGIVYFKTGKWMGNFKDGQPNGQGVFISSNGEKTKGTWRDGINVQYIFPQA